VRGVHVDQYQPLLVLCEDIDPVQLRERETERRRVRRVFVCGAPHCSGVRTRVPVSEHSGIARHRLRKAQGDLVGPRQYGAARRTSS